MKGIKINKSNDIQTFVWVDKNQLVGFYQSTSGRTKKKHNLYLIKQSITLK